MKKQTAKLAKKYFSESAAVCTDENLENGIVANAAMSRFAKLQIKLHQNE